MHECHDAVGPKLIGAAAAVYYVINHPEARALLAASASSLTDTVAFVEPTPGKNAPMAPGAEPLSIESLLQKQKEEREAAARVSRSSPASCMPSDKSPQPKFLSKEERAKIAIAKRAQEIQGEKRKEEESRRDREQLEREAELVRQQERESKYTSSAGPRRLCHYHLLL